jgi:hypothetical protein
MALMLQRQLGQAYLATEALAGLARVALSRSKIVAGAGGQDPRSAGAALVPGKRAVPPRAGGGVGRGVGAGYRSPASGFSISVRHFRSRCSIAPVASQRQILRIAASNPACLTRTRRYRAVASDTQGLRGVRCRTRRIAAPNPACLTRTRRYRAFTYPIFRTYRASTSEIRNPLP